MIVFPVRVVLQKKKEKKEKKKKHLLESVDFEYRLWHLEDLTDYVYGDLIQRQTQNSYLQLAGPQRERVPGGPAPSLAKFSPREYILSNFSKFAPTLQLAATKKSF